MRCDWPGGRMKIHNSSLARWMCLLAILTGIAASDPGAEAPLSFLHTRGQDIVNESGKTILLLGVGLGNWMLPEGYMWKFGDGGDRPRRIEHLVTELIGPEKGRGFWTEFRRNYISEADIQRIADVVPAEFRPESP